MGKKSIEGLIKHTKKRNQETLDKVNSAINKLKRKKNTKINFQTVSDVSGVSRATLYNNPEIKTRIISLRDYQNRESGKLSSPQKDILKQKNEKIKELYGEIKKLKKEMGLLIEQLIDMEELKLENERLKKKLGGGKKFSDKKFT